MSREQKYKLDITEFMIWVIEIVARKFFQNDKTLAYNTLKNTQIWDMYVNNYDVTHTLSYDYILDELSDILTSKGVISC